jgi:hypothetical protein
MAEKMSPVKAIKTYFERADKQTDGKPGRPVIMDELKGMTGENRAELAKLAAVELGVEIQA